MRRSTLPDCEPNSTSTLPEQPGVLVVRKHYFLVRWSHWLNVPILLGLILSGISIYWASPIYQHKPDPITGNFDFAAEPDVAGIPQRADDCARSFVSAEAAPAFFP